MSRKKRIGDRTDSIWNTTIDRETVRSNPFNKSRNRAVREKTGYELTDKRSVAIRRMFGYQVAFKFTSCCLKSFT